MKESIKRQNARPSLFIRVQEERLMETYSSIKPYLVRLFTHALLLFISVRAYENFSNSQTNYQEFLKLLNNTVVEDIALTNKSCSDLGKEWKPVANVTFPNILRGCRCDGGLYVGQSCDYIEGSNPIDAKNFETNCAYLDNLFNSNVENTNEVYFKEPIMPEDFKKNYQPNKFDLDNYNNKYGDTFYTKNNLTNTTNGYLRNLIMKNEDIIENVDNYNSNLRLSNSKINFFDKYKNTNTRILEIAGSRNLTNNSK
jgi:hypothetical protein